MLVSYYTFKSNYQMGLRHTRKGLSSSGSEWRNDLIIGETIRLQSAWYVPSVEGSESLFRDIKVWHQRESFFL